ncbi:hypothetical protein COCC4DRAFT_30948 [Bipolaris maydis ATCC 48331]|uniref:FAR1 domain-containing protein n=2 Tax=Cochliobolus heterostrophus TaxID=5016 RepID=M2V280_COCH5|nr:uncharacterized protein COCC4DRAFT_30948 [Bipolaris maydis ATCC 48331]EMD94148.1 hypothetical protein COCHEDRAFT_1020222 [Bipolaris maydis C5]KAJ5026662.1 hypothetical protein J3E73DRAFT_307981 [Bipolaris maydis]ENI07552.1 hypothetical protein COCC4DRAFT_30948 [Bipolaris maydis ATCC 48331]KAJ5059602.1 hypothetical protein J3E74DRAFT_349077 [Bipolaris maydis]KAJ6209595.1 hypothetical protein PSV09DRAFT_1020222 [Bipolaris maydis]
MMPTSYDATHIDKTALQPNYYTIESEYDTDGSVWVGVDSNKDIGNTAELDGSSEPAAANLLAASSIEPSGPAASSSAASHPQPAQHPRADEYRPRRIRHGELRGIGEYNLDNLWELSSRDRDHAPPPEALYDSHQQAKEAVLAWGRAHGVAYRSYGWTDRRHVRERIVCTRQGTVPVRKPTERPRTRMGATSQKTNCKMGFWLVAEDYTNLDTCQWRVKWMEGRKSFTHNHPPVKDTSAIAMYRRASRAVIPEERLKAIRATSRGANQALQMVRSEFPGVIITRQDIKNQFLKL